MEFTIKNDYGFNGNKEKAWMECCEGHYSKGDTVYGDKFYILDKYISKGEERTNKAIGLSKENAEFVFNALAQYLGKEV